ncbi:FHA domain-containing protein [Microlunatus sp. Gsoil 973]|uniref:FHA domain-containing protein n=1 Tax=Microlunatus sp. Gsoil 973 TaxID=2672569 RepID=UPI0012B4F109|nr:FHA domain-containing protein [Microlunatus sp. Gsoil 973]QGN34717.1 FHA domain-containing protein [Microlunatus sp. Gsoil 973]
MSEPKTDAAVTERAHWTSQWRARYRRGDWLVLAGPTSLVVMQPAAPQWSDLINAVWEEVVSSASIEELGARLAAFKLDRMPDFAALFWDRGQMRSLVRGGVSLVDPGTGRPIADGVGVRTWTEIGLGGLQRVELRAGEQSAVEELELPLVIGAANASRVLLDCSEEVQIHSPQGTLVGDISSLRLLDAPAPSAVVASEPTQPVPSPQPEPQPEPEPEPEPTVAFANPTPVPDQHQVMETGETLVDQPPVPPASSEDEGAKTIFASNLPGLPVSSQSPRSVLGVLLPSSGGRIEVDRPVVIGRSPAANRVSGDQLPRLLTVPSPSHDISRTHVQVAPENGRMVVTDLNSTNGTILVFPDGRRTDLRPGVGVPVEVGSVIDLGDGITIAVDRA